MSLNAFHCWMILRIVVGIVALPLTASALFLMLIQFQRGFDWVHTAVGVPMAILAYLCLQIVVWGHDAIRRHEIASMMLGGALGGGISAGLVFVGAILLLPGTNLAPMLAFLIVGPIGFIAGVVIKAVSLRKRSPT